MIRITKQFDYAYGGHNIKTLKVGDVIPDTDEAATCALEDWGAEDLGEDKPQRPRPRARKAAAPAGGAAS